MYDAYHLHAKVLVAGLSPRRPEIGPRTVDVGFVVDRVALVQVFLRVRRISPVIITSSLLHIHSCVIWGLDNGSVSFRSSI
jgi:hypothetical protein